jgi:hypothetical protein
LKLQKRLSKCAITGIPHEKYNQKNLKHLAISKKITGINTRTNQEQRDALMLIWGR